jgi:hypothetical protein
VINWFGPLEVNHKNYSIVDKIEAVMEKEWFFGDISKERAEDLLAGMCVYVSFFRLFSACFFAFMFVFVLLMKKKVFFWRYFQGKGSRLLAGVFFSVFVFFPVFFCLLFAFFVFCYGKWFFGDISKERAQDLSAGMCVFLYVCFFSGFFSVVFLLCLKK